VISWALSHWNPCSMYGKGIEDQSQSDYLHHMCKPFSYGRKQNHTQKSEFSDRRMGFQTQLCLWVSLPLLFLSPSLEGVIYVDSI